MPEAVGKRSDFEKILAEMIDKSGALSGLLITKDGIAVAQAGDTSYFNTDALSALVAGMFSATREVARMVGEDQFSMLLQQGENRHIHISLIQDTRMMVIIFEGYERIGFVRHEARRAGTQLAKLVEKAETRPATREVVATTEFKEYALNAIDRIFQTR
jgi:predicted regulator of Ras-like GTPase activity (Roadblock/LC7/MglB family)